MFRTIQPIIAIVCTGFLLPFALGNDLAVAASAAMSPISCETCSTTATSYTFSKSKVHTTSYYWTGYAQETVEILDITKGIETVTRLDLTSTKTITARSRYTDFDNGERHYTELITRTVHNSSTTTTFVCAPTYTPSGYPAPTYCECKKTSTKTIGLLKTTITYATPTTYLTTQIVQPTLYGDTERSTTTFTISTYPFIARYRYTKTIYRSTSTVTLAPPSPTATNIGTFKLKAINNPYLFFYVPDDSQSYVNNQVFPGYFEPATVVWANESSATVFEISGDSGRLHDITNNRTCGFYPYDGSYQVLCGTSDVDSSEAGHISVDCFGNLRAYAGNSTSWAINPTGRDLRLMPQLDPVHGLHDYGDIDDYGWLFFKEFVDLQVIAYSL